MDGFHELDHDMDLNLMADHGNTYVDGRLCGCVPQNS